jgi:Tripartite tricarboxylate transporter family receptor
MTTGPGALASRPFHAMVTGISNLQARRQGILGRHHTAQLLSRFGEHCWLPNRPSGAGAVGLSGGIDGQVHRRLSGRRAQDIVGRVIADRPGALWKVPTVVENIAGAAGNLGIDRVAKGASDGGQILIVPPGIAKNQFLYPRVPFDPEKDFSLLGHVASVPNLLCVREDLPVNSVPNSSPTPRPIRASSITPPRASVRPSTCRPSCSSA